MCSCRAVESQPPYARSLLTMLPEISVSRKSRPWNLYVSLVWSMPMQVENGGVHVVDVDGIFHHVVTQFVGLPERHAGLDASAGQPHGEGARMVVAAEKLRLIARFVHGRAPEFSAPDDQRGIQQAALLQVLDERGGCLVSFLAKFRQAMNNVVVGGSAVACPSRDDKAAQSARRAPPVAAPAGNYWRTISCPARCRTSCGCGSGSLEISASSGTLVCILYAIS